MTNNFEGLIAELSLAEDWKRKCVSRNSATY